jgi:hypothetical protein
MKAQALSILLAFVCAVSNFAQYEGQLLLGNRSIVAPSGEMFNVPIWIDMDADGAYDPGEGIGSYAAAIGMKASLALYLRDDPTPLATAVFRSDIHGGFLGSPAIQSVAVSGYLAQQSAPLTIKVWIGESFEASSIRGSWNFTSPPLGGMPADAGVPPLVPTMLYTWGPFDGSGFALQAPAGPVTGTDRLLRRTLSDVRTSIATLLANDSDPSGGAIFFVGADARSQRGATMVVTQQGEVIYSGGSVTTTDAFYYTVRDSAGGVSRGRVDVVIDDPDGLIVFETRNIPRVDGNGTYNVPLYVDANLNGAENMGEAFGAFAETYYAQKGKLGLFLAGRNDPLAVMEIAPPEVGVFTEVPGASLRIVTIPGVSPGFPAHLTIKAWIGDTFEDSRLKGSWNFTSLVLGGTIAHGASFPIPGLTGWGPETGEGLGLSPGAAPTASADEIARGYREDATITIETLLANDVDPEGGALVFLDFDRTTAQGATIKRSDSTLIYHSPSAVADHFFYTVRSSRGVIAKGRVNVKTGEPVGEILLTNSETPIWVDLDADGVRDQHEGVGHYASLIGQSAQAAFHIQGQAEPFAVTHFNSYPIGSEGAFLTAPDNTTLVPGFKPGQRVPITVKVWVGNSFHDATVKGSWDFVSLQLGGPINTGDAVVAPTLAGWGNENGPGYALAADTNVVLPPIVIPIRIYDPIRIWYHLIVPIGDTATGLYLPEFTTGGNAIIQFTNNAVVEATLFHNDSFAYSVATPTGMSVGVVGLQVQESPAKMFLSNRLVRRANGPGGYNVPVWVDLNFNGARDRGEGIGSFAAKEFSADATLGLFLRDATTPIATARFDRDAGGAFLDDPDFQEVVIPSVSPGAQVPLTLKAWIGDSFATATIKSSWDFTSKQLGGAARTGIFETPDVTGWGDETTSRGYAILPGSKPKTYGTVITRQPGRNANVKIADIIKNDSDPDGGALTFVSVDDSSKEGGVISLLGDTAYYVAPLQDSGAPDYFEYTVRNSKGGIAKGRVDVVVADSQGQFNTRLAIEHTATGHEITFRGVTGANYLVQFRDTIDGAWQDLGPAVHEAFGLFRINVAITAGTRFYRVVTQP